MQSWCIQKFACKWHYIITLSICQFGSMWKWNKPYKDLDWWFGDLYWVKWWSNDGSSFHWHIVKSSKRKLQTLQVINDHMLSQIEHLCNVARLSCGCTCARGLEAKHCREVVQKQKGPNTIGGRFETKIIEIKPWSIICASMERSAKCGWT